ncbi:MAG: peptide chain release factor 2 [Candidatus Omnitrophica bacterium]|nr:peptide chain release factor 2 [Candidatus Omnitrophota bacterium]
MLEQIKLKLSSIHNHLEQLRGYLDVDNKRQKINQLSLLMSESGFWDNPEKSSEVVKELKFLKAGVESWENASKRYQELKELIEVITADEQELIKELSEGVDKLLKELEDFEIRTILSGEFDRNNAILSINAGAGGTEACDWVAMLLRMYVRFAQRHGYNPKAIDMLAGEEAGIKNVTLLIEGDYAYGYLKSERGVHRLVRISPFDANKRRHTSFASVDVLPEIEEDIEIKLQEKDLKIETFRSSGPGGQHMQKSDSAVRITHLPTNIVVQSQNERSQYQNKKTCLKILKARLYELERQKKEQELFSQYGSDKKKIEWGSQIRSYILHPYNLIKDHRSNYETTDVARVMDGELDEFIQAYLKNQKVKAKN